MSEQSLDRFATPVSETRCSSCGAPIVWARFAKSGAAVPLDVDRHDGNLLVLTHIGSVPIVTVVSKLERLRLLALGRALWLTHFATCPDATEHRRR